MASSRNLNRHTRVAALANVQKLAARAALGRARDAEDDALASLASAGAERDQTLQFWQERLLAPVLDPLLFGQLTHLLANNEIAYDEAEQISKSAQSQVLERQAYLGEAESRHSALKRALARTRRKLSRKREDAAESERECGAHRGARS